MGSASALPSVHEQSDTNKRSELDKANSPEVVSKEAAHDEDDSTASGWIDHRTPKRNHKLSGDQEVLKTGWGNGRAVQPLGSASAHPSVSVTQMASHGSCLS